MTKRTTAEELKKKNTIAVSWFQSKILNYECKWLMNFADQVVTQKSSLFSKSIQRMCKYHQVSRQISGITILICKNRVLKRDCPSAMQWLHKGKGEKSLGGSWEEQQHPTQHPCCVCQGYPKIIKDQKFRFTGFFRYLSINLFVKADCTIIYNCGGAQKSEKLELKRIPSSDRQGFIHLGLNIFPLGLQYFLI